jgi:hypothetical protein
MSGDRVAVEEVQNAITLVLKAAGGLTADELLSEVRQVLGVAKAPLTPAFNEALQTLLRDQVIGEGSAGYALRA